MIKQLILPVFWVMATIWGCFTGAVQRNLFLPREILAKEEVEAAKTPGPGNILIRGNSEKLSQITGFIRNREVKRRVLRAKSAGALQASYVQVPEGMFVAKYLRGIDMILLAETPVNRSLH